MRSSAGWPPRPLSKRPVDAAYEPTHDDHQVSGTFLNESPDVDQETKHRILDGSQKRITLYWRRCNIYEDPNVGRYSYKMDFVIIPDLNMTVIFGSFKIASMWGKDAVNFYDLPKSGTGKRQKVQRRTWPSVKQRKSLSWASHRNAKPKLSNESYPSLPSRPARSQLGTAARESPSAQESDEEWDIIDCHDLPTDGSLSPDVVDTAEQDDAATVSHKRSVDNDAYTACNLLLITRAPRASGAIGLMKENIDSTEHLHKKAVTGSRAAVEPSTEASAPAIRAASTWDSTDSKMSARQRGEHEQDSTAPGPTITPDSSDGEHSDHDITNIPHCAAQNTLDTEESQREPHRSSRRPSSQIVTSKDTSNWAPKSHDVYGQEDEVPPMLARFIDSDPLPHWTDTAPITLQSSTSDKVKRKARKVGGARQIEPRPDHDLSPAPEAKDYWTWDDQKQRYYHTNPETGTHDYYQSDSETE